MVHNMMLEQHKPDPNWWRKKKWAAKNSKPISLTAMPDNAFLVVKWVNLESGEIKTECDLASFQNEKATGSLLAAMGKSVLHGMMTSFGDKKVDQKKFDAACKSMAAVFNEECGVETQTEDGNVGTTKG